MAADRPRALDLTRRDFLAGAAAAGLAGCSAAVPSIAGEIVGGPHRLGHRLRSGDVPPPQRTERVGVVIVGAGVAGLSAARMLAAAGVRDFVVLELEDAPGGNSRAGVSAVTPYPWGAHYLPLPGPEAAGVRRLLRDLGVIERVDAAGRARYDERYLCHAPQERLFAHGRWQEGLYPHTGASAEDLTQYEAFSRAMAGYRRWRDGAGRRAFTAPRSAGSPGAFADLDRMSMADFLTARGWTSPRLAWYVAYACRDDFGTLPAETSAWAGVHYYAAREGDPEYGGEAVLTWPEGNGWLTARMAEAAAGRLETGLLVTSVEPGPRGVAVDLYDAQGGTSRRLLAREVVLACPVLVAARIYRPWRERPPGFVTAFEYAPWVVSNVHVSQPPADDRSGVPRAWDNVIWDSPSLGYVVATHQTLRTGGGPTVLTHYESFPAVSPSAARASLLATPWPAWRDRVLADLARPHPGLPATVGRIDVMLYGHAMVRPTPGFVCGPALAAAASALGGPVHLAHSDLSGFSLFEEAFDWGSRAAARVLRRLGRSPSAPR